MSASPVIALRVCGVHRFSLLKLIYLHISITESRMPPPPKTDRQILIRMGMLSVCRL